MGPSPTPGHGHSEGRACGSLLPAPPAPTGQELKLGGGDVDLSLAVPQSSFPSHPIGAVLFIYFLVGGTGKEKFMKGWGREKARQHPPPLLLVVPSTPH